jgi:hypothetical protein
MQVPLVVLAMEEALTWSPPVVEPPSTGEQGVANKTAHAYMIVN